MQNFVSNHTKSFQVWKFFLEHFLTFNLFLQTASLNQSNLVPYSNMQLQFQQQNTYENTNQFDTDKKLNLPQIAQPMVQFVNQIPVSYF